MVVRDAAGNRYSRRAAEPDIWKLVTMGAALAVTRDAIVALEPFLSECGELLPLMINGSERDDLFALNITTVVEHETCIEVSRSAADAATLRSRMLDEHADVLTPLDRQLLLEADDPWPIIYPDFIPEAVPASGLFKVNRLIPDIFVSEADGEDSFVERVTANGLTSVGFETVWTAQAGPSDINLFGEPFRL